MGFEQDAAVVTPVAGRVKWFDATKGFGFVVDDFGGPDILLHANVLRSYGRSSISEGARVRLKAQATGRGLQAVEVLSVSSPDIDELEPSESKIEMPDVSNVPFEPARMKWFDKAKGFGFANIFGKPEDVFVHVEVLRQCGFSELQPGEAVAIKVVDGPRGKMAAKVSVWGET